MVTHINYNGGKQVKYQYNKVGDLVKMDDWTGTNIWEADLLGRITKATKRRMNRPRVLGNGHKNNDKPNGNDVKKTSTVIKDFVVDYTSATRNPLMEYETDGFTYRYVYGNARLSVNVTGVEQGQQAH